MPTYSASRLNTFESCKLKYDLNYNKGYYAEESQQSILTRKGSAFHQFAETYDPTWTQDQLLASKVAIEQKYGLPPEFALDAPISRFLEFHADVLQTAIRRGAKVSKEIELKFSLGSYSFTGKLDVLIEYPDGTYHIIDYKTGKNSSSTKYYMGQMMLYVFGVHQLYTVPKDSIDTNIAVNLFFPLADADADSYKKSFKKIKFTKDDLQKELDKYESAIKLIESASWNTEEANLSKLCEFCPFIGRITYCPLSAKAGLLPTRGVIIKQRRQYTHDVSIA